MELKDEFKIESFKEGNRFEAKLAKGGIPSQEMPRFLKFQAIIFIRMSKMSKEMSKKKIEFLRFWL